MAIERVQPIELTDNETGKVYTLEFNRDVVRRAERNGSPYQNSSYDIPHSI